MSETKIQVPVGMSEAFHKAENHGGFKWDDAVLDAMLSAALRWLSENPIVPTREEANIVLAKWDHPEPWCLVQRVVRAWNRRMFLAPEVPEAIRDLLIDEEIPQEAMSMSGDQVNEAILEAYRRGQQSK